MNRCHDMDINWPTSVNFMEETPIYRPLVPLWDLEVNLDGFAGPTFEHLEEAVLKHLSLKTVSLLALASATWVSDIHALLVHLISITKTNPAFVP